VSPTSSPPRRKRRRRHDPRETEREILEAAEELLRERPFREVTVESIMLRTGLKRPAFYAHFRDRHDLVLRVVEHIGAQLFAMSDRWFKGEEPRADMHRAITGVAEVYLVHGPVLRALADASTSDERVEQAYRTLVQAFIDATAEHVAEAQRAGLTAPDMDPREVSRALVLLNERYLSETFGRTPPEDPRLAVETLYRIWDATLYGPAGDSPPR
jgi:AcrR family transcriptional regulator